MGGAASGGDSGGRQARYGRKTQPGTGAAMTTQLPANSPVGKTGVPFRSCPTIQPFGDARTLSKGGSHGSNATTHGGGGAGAALGRAGAAAGRARRPWAAAAGARPGSGARARPCGCRRSGPGASGARRSAARCSPRAGRTGTDGRSASGSDRAGFALAQVRRRRAAQG